MTMAVFFLLFTFTFGLNTNVDNNKKKFTRIENKSSFGIIEFLNYLHALASLL